MKEVLVVYYSQTGQQRDILKNIMQPFDTTTSNITYHEIKPVKQYPFPWPKLDFFDVFPESFLQIPTKLEPIPASVLDKKYDLVILGYTVWYLTPSIPINSFLKSPEGKKLLQDTPVVTVIGVRNMWIMAQEKMKQLLVDCNARLVGNIALVDRSFNHISVITIQHWMLAGKKDRLWGIFPKPGVSDKDISEASKFGVIIQEALLSNDYVNLQDRLLEKDAVIINPSLITTDKRGNVVFSKWSNMLIKKGGPNNPKRRKLLPYFNYYMIFAIWVIAPIVFIVFLLTYLPLYGKIKKDKKYYASVRLKQD